MNELNQKQLNQVNGGIHWAIAWAVASGAFMATDASRSAAGGFDRGFKSSREESRRLNGWD
jgi:lactobin A/cerein 7B family class IIb bacteriocin